MIDGRILARFDEAGVPVCVIGAAALAVHGFPRATADIDLLTIRAEVLEDEFWAGFAALPEIRRGDVSDPLRGVLRWRDLGVDVVVGWPMHAFRVAVETAEPSTLYGCRVATPLALVLLKLEAESPLDQRDILGLIGAQRVINGAPWEAELPAQVAHLSEGARAVWAKIEPDLASL